MGGMRLKTAMGHEKRFKAIIGDIYASAACFKVRSETIGAELTRRLYSDPAWPKVPEWTRAYIQGYHEATRNAMWRTLEWRHWFRGAWVDSKVVDAAGPGAWQEIRAGCHFWPGSDRPFGNPRHSIIFARLDRTLKRRKFPALRPEAHGPRLITYPALSPILPVDFGPQAPLFKLRQGLPKHKTGINRVGAIITRMRA